VDHVDIHVDGAHDPAAVVQEAADEFANSLAASLSGAFANRTTVTR
jgi:hypothetical protein